jgi:hypothetical protein
MKKVAGLLVVIVMGNMLCVPYVEAWVGSRPVNIRWVDVTEELLKATKIKPFIKKTEIEQEELTANVLTDTVKSILAPVTPRPPKPSPTPKPSEAPKKLIVETPKLNTSQSLTLTRSDVAEEIRVALTKALGTSPYTDGTSYPYLPVYQQISRQSYSNVVGTGQSKSSGTTLSSIDLTGGGSVTLSGALGIANGGTGLATAPTYGKLLLGNSAGGYDLVATSSLGLGSGSFVGTTDDITEGTTNLFYSDSLIHASTTIPKTYSSNTFSGANSFTGTFTLSNLNGPLHANNGVVGATTSISVLYGGTGATSFGQGWIYSAGGSAALAASTSPTINYIVATSTRASILPYASTTVLSASGLCISTDCRTSWPVTSAGLFTTATNFNLSSSATTTAIWFQNQVFGSSTAIFGGNVTANTFIATGTSASVLPYASSTAATATSLYSTTLRTTTIGVSSTTPSSTFSVNGTAWMDLTTFNLASTSSTGLTINYLASTTNIIGQGQQGAWSLATSSSSSGNPIVNVSTSAAGATSTIGFFVSTTTGLVAGVGNTLPSALKNYVIVGNGKVQAGMAIVRGGLCVDSDGWCTASTTGLISASAGIQTANADLAEIYYSNSTLEPGDVVTTVSPATYVTKAERGMTEVVGVVSSKPGLVLGLGPDQDNTSGYPIALAGRVPLKVTAEKGVIKTGDMLTLSSIPGVAEKLVGDGYVIAQALESYEDVGIGKILAIVKNTYFTAPVADLAFLKTMASSTENRIIALENELKNLKGLVVDTLGSAGLSLNILSDVNFFGRPYFTSDTVGSALIKTGARSVNVTFDRDYTDTPEVQASISLTEANAAAAADEAIFAQDVRFLVLNRNAHGFTIKLNKAAPADITFSWLALASKGKLFSSEPVVANTTPTISPSPAPAPVIEDNPTAEVSVEASTTPVIIEEAVAETVPEPVQEVVPEVSVEQTSPEVVAEPSPEPSPVITE